MEYATNMQIIELDSFSTAFEVKPGEEGAVSRRFMTLIGTMEERASLGGTSYVMRAQTLDGLSIAMKRLLPKAGIPKDAMLSEADTARITQGHEAAFYEEYRNQLSFSHLPGFPKLYGFASIEGEPAILMEWVEGMSLRHLRRDRQHCPDGTLPARTVAQIGVAVLEVLGQLGDTLVHRDISPANIMLRTDTTPLEQQLETGEFDICLIDFGSAAANPQEGDPSFTVAMHMWRNGTPEYAPPEMLTHDLPHVDKLRKSQKIDVFALCSVLYELYSAHTPWRVSENTNLSPYRLKTENPPYPLEPRAQGDEALVEAIVSGLAVEQRKRPSVPELLASLQQFLGVEDIAPDDEDGAPFQTPETMEENRRGHATRKSAVAKFAPPGLYTPKSTHLTMATYEEGGKRASAPVSAYKRERTVSRRSLIIGGIAVAAAAIGGGLFVSSTTKPKSEAYLSEGEIATEISDDTETPWVWARDISSISWSLIDAQNEEANALRVFTPRDPGQLVNGLMRVCHKTYGAYGFMTIGTDGNGQSQLKWYIKPQYPRARDFSASQAGATDVSSDLAAVQDAQSGLWGYINRSNTFSIPPRYADAKPFSNGCAAVQSPESKLWGLIDADGNELVPPQFLELGMCSSEGLMGAAASSRLEWQFVTLDSSTQGYSAQTGAYRKTHRFTEGLAGFFDADRQLWGFIDPAGTQVIAPQYSDVHLFANGEASAQDRESQLWGLIDAQPDSSGKKSWLVEPRYLNLGDAVHGLVIPAHEMDETRESSYNLSESPGCRYGYINQDGSWAVKPKYGDTLIRSSEQ